MKITDHIKNANGKTLFSLEVVPPQKGIGIEDLYKNIDPLMEFKPPFIDVTTSREEYIYIDKGNGLMERRITRMRPGTLGICAAIQHKYNVDTVPHLLCGGFTKEETEYLLVDCMYLGIDNIMALRGDAMKGHQYFEATPGGHSSAMDLVNQINNLGRGKYLHDDQACDEHNKFCIGVAGYPEKHMEAPSMNYDLKWLKQKVDAGADYIVTQMFFDNKKYIEFVTKAREMGITVPIIPGIKPIATKKHLKLLPQVFKIDLPEDLINAVESAKNNEAVKQIGVEWAISQCKELLDFGVPVLHFYSMGKSDNIKKVAGELF
ncbi:methylenetetrahydrofolate reductase [NAD(P)H] [Chryseobacterium sp. 09-1422]|jgi:methylenetetrahydrofolate reductase (NADPH)|uniref:Methylenetetrahydrofolate reductase n=3 Tax=Chryseobacterium TaxID=59732 RepID=A0ABT3I0X2_9FLAO|nr:MULTISPECIES: methylenetetrahydrofolate reductase [NAD(P)H] [Chryseobacterium]KQS93609.1 5,10-methylenetetrahydrofolate reductase [Chryseobacterium sp. Leaf394]MBD8083453.1 methylenetetrahydrofolate reductase [NAD(P)H] [Chryseobacterium caseinilyticum]MCW3169699.1 methylenetetrahydrofolate reductase [NAD(P)H] [Chryseobacterium kimseyorum]MCX8532037.1 methylenetetrahydrofolate reductase [NAD(P)H] [Chryseobacterium luquanense]